MSAARLVAAIAVLALVGLAACGDDDTEQSATSDKAADATETRSGESDAEAPFEVDGEPVATQKVDLPRSYKFTPAVIEVAPGSEVTWDNNDDFPHNVKVFGLTDEAIDLPIGGSASFRFEEPGTFYYQCTLHPTQMKGKVIVTA